MASPAQSFPLGVLEWTSERNQVSLMHLVPLSVVVGRQRK